MNEFRIEKLRQRVAIVLAGGVVLEGDIFLQPTARYRSEPQDPEDLFNEADTFVPLGTADGQYILVCKDQVLRVQYDAVASDTEVGDVSDATVEIVFADGSACCGALRLETRADRTRVLDFLNSEQRRFLLLRSPSGVCLVNRRHVAQVHHRR